MKIGFIDKIIIFIFSIILIVDSLNGLLLLNNIKTGVSLSQLIKLPLLFLMLFRISVLNIKYLVHIICILVCLLFSLFINYLNAIDISFVDELILILKLLVIPISVYYFVCLKKLDYDYYYKSITKIFFIALIVLLTNVFLSVIGVGYSSYSGGIGNKGFFYAGNELSALFLIINAFMLSYVYNKHKQIYYYLMALVSMIIGLLISTKVSMLSIVIIVILIPLVNLKLKITPKLIRNSVFFLLAVCLISFVLLESILRSEVLVRWTYFFKVYDYDFVSILLSGRNKTLIESWQMNNINFEPFNAFFGYTYTGFIENLKQSSFYRAKSNEMDFFDLYFMYGLLGLMSVLSVWFVALYNYFKSEKINIILLVTVILILFISFISGHILYSGLSGPFIGIYLSLMFRHKTNNVS